jgi:hypothetical protein
MTTTRADRIIASPRGIREQPPVLDPSIGALAAQVESATRALLRHASVGNSAALLVLSQAEQATRERATEAGRMLHRQGHTYRSLADLLHVSQQRAFARFAPRSEP